MKTWMFASLLWLVSSAHAHEFWMAPDRFAPAVNEPVTLSLRVGEAFLGEPAAFALPMAVSLNWHHLRGQQNLTPQLPASPEQAVQIAFDRAGTQLIALDTKPVINELPADEFTAYLKEDGLEHVIAQREASGQSAAPGRERYRRHVKTLINVGGQSDTVFGARTGQTLEIVPLLDPQRLRAGGAIPVEVLFKGAPLKGALVRVWNRRGEQFDVSTQRTDASGKATMPLPWGGVWMVSVVHMVPNPDGQGQDWDSHWGNLTFELPAAPAMRRPL